MTLFFFFRICFLGFLFDWKVLPMAFFNNCPTFSYAFVYYCTTTSIVKVKENFMVYYNKKEAPCL